MLPDPLDDVVGRTRRHYRNRQETDADDPKCEQPFGGRPGKRLQRRSSISGRLDIGVPAPVQGGFWPTGSFTGVRWFVKSSVDPSVMGLVMHGSSSGAKNAPSPETATGRPVTGRHFSALARGR